MSLRKGFTLIELLVVIAIIGILSSVVLASLNTARGRGRDASSTATINSARTQAELYFDTNGDYDGLCADATFDGLIDDAAAANGGTSTCAEATDNNDYAISVTLPSSTDAAADVFCVDSTGFAGKVGAAPAANTSCGGVTF